MKIIPLANHQMKKRIHVIISAIIICYTFGMFGSFIIVQTGNTLGVPLPMLFLCFLHFEICFPDNIQIFFSNWHIFCVSFHTFKKNNSSPDPVVLFNFLKTKFQNIFSEPRFTISGNAQFLLPSSDIF